VASFWAEFAARNYRREPFEADDPPAGFAVGPAEMHKLLVRACAERGAGPGDPDVRFFIGQREVRHDLDDHLPTAADGGLAGYLERLEGQFGDQPYLLTIRRVHAASRWVWKQAARFLVPLYDATGVLPGDVEVVAFAGRYPFTSAGIHRERSGVFVWMIEGSKDILVWPPQAQARLPLASARYRDAVASARRLRCAPGRLVYWPSFYWHVGESPAAPSVGLHLCLVEPPPEPGNLLAAAFAEASHVPGPADPGIAGAGSGRDKGLGWQASAPRELGLSAAHQAAVAELIRVGRDPAIVSDKLTADWLRRRTGLGFTVPPPRFATAPLAGTSVVARDSVLPIVLAPRDAVTSWCAADGRAARLRTAAALAELIRRLNTGRPLPVHDALSLASTPVEHDLLTQTLAMLAGWRALTVTPPPPTP
jgi:hypothetical protein